MPCADLTALALVRSDGVGLRCCAEVISNDVITDSGSLLPILDATKCTHPKTVFVKSNHNSSSGPAARQSATGSLWKPDVNSGGNSQSLPTVH